MKPSDRFKGLLDFLYPRACSNCERPVGEEGSYLCWDCLSETIVIQPPFCARCGDPIAGRVDHEYVCHFCAANPIHFDYARSAARFDGALRKAILDLKYRQSLWLASDLGGLLEGCARSHFDLARVDWLACVPLFPSKLRQRGFNQSAVLAADLAGRIAKPFRARALRRIRNTPTQTHLTASQRLTNVKGAFDSHAFKEGERPYVLLIDDVMTTGATVNECARMLKRAGAARVDVLTIARG